MHFPVKYFQMFCITCKSCCIKLTIWWFKNCAITRKHVITTASTIPLSFSSEIVSFPLLLSIPHCTKVTLLASKNKNVSPIDKFTAKKIVILVVGIIFSSFKDSFNGNTETSSDLFSCEVFFFLTKLKNCVTTTHTFYSIDYHTYSIVLTTTHAFYSMYKYLSLKFISI